MCESPPGGRARENRKFILAPSDKNLSKNGSVPIKGVGFSVKDVFAKKFLVPGEIPLAARSHRFFGTLAARGQQPDQIRRIGVLLALSEKCSPEESARISALN